MNENGLKKYLLRSAGTVVGVLLVQSAALIWWAATISVRMDYVERDVNACSARLYAVETGATGATGATDATKRK